MNPFSRISDAEKLSVDQLKEAMQGKTLPAYIAIPLIEEKMDMQSRMKGVMAMQQAQQQQPPIAQQVMQRVDTEGGIDQLPTSLPPAGMAGGGIVAFDNGGDVRKKYDAAELNKLWEALKYTGAVGEDVISAPTRWVMDAAGRPAAAIGSALGYDIPIPSGAYSNEKGMLTPRSGHLKSLEDFTSLSLPGGGNQEPPEEDKAHAQVGAAPPAPPAPPVSPGQGGGFGAMGYGIGSTSVPSAMKMVKGVLGDYTKDSEAREKTLMEGLKGNQLGGKAFHEYESMLRKEAEEAGVDKEKAKSMAIFKAGLAMMAGTHPNALVNIGQGAMVGAEDYQNAYEKLKQADRQRTKEFALIEQARRAEVKNDVDRRDSLLMKAFEIGQKRSDVVASALIQGGVADVNNAADLAKTFLAGSIQLQAAQTRAAATTASKQGTASLKGLTAIADEVRKEMPYEAFKAQYAKKSNYSKTPEVGANPAFDRQTRAAYLNYIESVSRDRYEDQQTGVFGAMTPNTQTPIAPGYRILPQDK